MPDWALLPLMAKREVPLFFSVAVTNLLGEGALVRVPGLAAAGVEAPLQVGLDPRAAAGAAAEPALGAEVDGVHRAGGVGRAGCLAVAVVEAAAVVDVGAAGHHVHAFGCAAGRHAGQVAVPPVAVAGVDVERVGLVAPTVSDSEVAIAGRLWVEPGTTLDPWYHRSLPRPDWS